MTKNMKNGFTIVELSVAMGFVSFLLLSIVLLTVGMTGIYQRGLTLRYMDQKGRELTELIARDIRNSRDESAVNGREWDRFGVFCTALSRYVWIKKQGDESMFRVNGEERSFGLVRVAGITGGTSSSHCGFGTNASASSGSIRHDSSNPNNIIIDDATMNILQSGVELLPQGTNADLVVQSLQRLGGTTGDGDRHCPDGEIWDANSGACIDLTTGEPTGNGRVRSNYASMILVLTTLRGNTSTNLANDGKCRMDMNNRQFQYCALNKFEFGARIGARQ